MADGDVVDVPDEDGGQKRPRDDDDEEEEERPNKKLKLELDTILCDWSSLLLGNDTPKKSPADSAYYSYPSIGESSGIGVSPQSCGLFSPNGKWPFTSTPEKQFPSHDRLKDLFRCNYKSLKDELEPKHGLADKLYATEVLSDKDMEKIKEEPSRSRRADIFIKALAHSSKAKLFGITQKIWNVFKDENLDYLLLANENTSGAHVKTLDMGPAMTSATDEFFISELQFLAKGLEENLEPKDIIDDLVVSGCLSFMDHEDIYITPSRHMRVKILVEHVKRGGRQNFHLFERALVPSYPEIANQLKDSHLDHMLPAKEIAVGLNPRLGTNTTPDNKTKNIFISATMMELKLNCIGEESASDVEISAVNTNNSALNLPLEEEAMEIGNASVLAFEYSSVRIKFAALSEETVSKFIESLNEPVDLQRLINQIFTQDQLLLLEKRNIHKIRIELNVPERSLITRKCTCRISKKLIVKYFTFLERELKDVMKYLEDFCNSKLIDLATRKELSELKDDRVSTTSKTETFLRKLLTLPEKAICLFEKQLKANGQHDLIETITEKLTPNQASSMTCHIGPRELRRNITFLTNEIEPKLFVSCFENTDIKTEDIISSDSRRNRCKKFVESMIKAGQSAIDKFIKDLKRQDMTFVLDVLCRKENENQGVTTEDIRKNVLKHYASLVNEIKPTRLRQKLVQERVFKAPEFDEILKVSTQRRGRVVWLLRKLLQKKSNCLPVFVDALKIANYLEIASMILNVSGDNMDCPFMLSKMDEDISDDLKPNNFTYSAEFVVKWTKETPTESELQLSLHKAIYQTSEIDKAKYTETWVQNQQQRKENDDELPCDFANKENKRPENKIAVKECDIMNVNTVDTSGDAVINFEFSDNIKEHPTAESKPVSLCSRVQAFISDKYHVENEPGTITTCLSKLKEEDRKTKTDDDTASIPSVFSNGRHSPYQNTFEDITPCQSPDISSPVNKLASFVGGPDFHSDRFLQFSPISPCGSGGTACNSDSFSPTQSPTSVRPSAIRSKHKAMCRGQSK